MARRGVVIAGGAAAVVLVAGAAAWAVTAARASTVVPGVTVEGVELGGLGEQDAVAALSEVATARETDGVVFTHDGTEYRVDAAAIGAEARVEDAVAAALDVGRGGSLFGDRVRSVTGVEAALGLQVSYDEEALLERLAEIAEAVDREVSPGDVEVVPTTLEVRTTPPTTGVTVDAEEAAAAVAAALPVPGEESLELPVEVTQPETDQADVDAVAAVAEAAVAEDLLLRSEDGELVLAPRDVARLLSATQVGTGAGATLELGVTQAAVAEVVVPLAEPLLREPRDAGFDAPRTPPVSYDDPDDARWSPVAANIAVVPGRNGTQLDPEITANQLSQALNAGEREVVLELPEQPPAFTTQDARDAGLDQLLSTFTTYHSCCAARVTNIQRLADLVDGTLVLPGEQFSINQISGVRECSKGFAEAGMILNGEIVPSCGGGVSQFGTTTVNAVFFAGLQPDAYKPHSFYISRYPQAREATLNFPSPDIDVRFTNDTGAPILVRTSYTGTSITVSFYGSSDVEEVVADVGSPYNVKPFQTIRRIDRSLPAGVSTTVQSGINGFRVNLTRTVRRTDGTVEEDDWSNTYVSATQIVEYNPDRPDPEPDPSEDPGDEPSPDPSPSESDG